MTVQLFDSAVTLSLDLNRVDAYGRALILAHLKVMQAEIIGKLAQDNLSTFGKARANKLLKEIEGIISGYYVTIDGELFRLTSGIADVAVKHTAESMAAAVSLEIALPTAAVIEQLGTNSLIQGAASSAWWERQSSDTAWRMSSIVRQGILSGEANGTIISRVKDSLNIGRANASALVQTSVQTVANNARAAVSEANADLIKAQLWLTALDSHVCNLCAPRADKTWNMQTKKPIGHSIDYSLPPAHFSCRCLMVDIMKTYKELGIPVAELPIGTRASSDGQVPADLTFKGFLDRKGAAFQDEVLGPGRAQMYRDGKITLQDLINGNGKPLTLAQLQAKYG